MPNPNRIPILDFLNEEGRTLEEIAEAVLYGDENAPALCRYGCEVEPDGTCHHGCPSILLAAGLI